MPRLVISGAAQAFADDPQSDEPITDPESLRFLHGMYSDEVCSDYFDDQLSIDATIQGGRLRFIYTDDDQTLRISTAYDVSRDLTEDERGHLVDATLEQWSDGIGSGSYRSFRGSVLSASLAKALLNSNVPKEDLGELFVDTYPFLDDRNIRIEFHEDGNADDELIEDLLSAVGSDDPSALLELGQRYQEGDGVEQNDELAVVMFTRSASHGHPIGATYLGMCLLSGRGIEEDQPRAIECFQFGAGADFPLAMHFLGECYSNGLGVDPNLEQAVDWYKRGAELGDPGCIAELGDCLEFGNGIEMDLEEALRMYKLAQECGLDAVQEAIGRVESQLGA